MSEVPWKAYFDSDVLRFVDLTREYVVQIESVKKGKVTGSGGKQSGKPIIKFVGWPKPLAACAEVCSMIENMYGKYPSKWVGKWLTIWPDPTVKFSGRTVGGVRCRPTPPDEKQQEQAKAELAKRAADSKGAA